MLKGCDESVDAVLVVGQHAKSNTDGGHLAHTGSFATDVQTFNGLSIGELVMVMLVAGSFGVPTVLATGDEACAAEAQALVPEVETVAVTVGLRRGSAAGLDASGTHCSTGRRSICTPLGRAT